MAKCACTRTARGVASCAAHTALFGWPCVLACVRLKQIGLGHVMSVQCIPWRCPSHRMCMVWSGIVLLNRCAPASALSLEADLHICESSQQFAAVLKMGPVCRGWFDSMGLPMRACMSCGIMHPLHAAAARAFRAKHEQEYEQQLRALPQDTVPRSCAHGMRRAAALPERAVRRALRRYGVGKWRLIQMDEAHGPVLAARSNVDLKVGAAGHARARAAPAHALAGM